MDSQPALPEEAEVTEDAQIQNAPSMHLSWHSSMLQCKIFRWMRVLLFIATQFHTCRCQAQPRAWEKASDFGSCQCSRIPLLWVCSGLKEINNQIMDDTWCKQAWFAFLSFQARNHQWNRGDSPRESKAFFLFHMWVCSSRSCSKGGEN